MICACSPCDRIACMSGKNEPSPEGVGVGVWMPDEPPGGRQPRGAKHQRRGEEPGAIPSACHDERQHPQESGRQRGRRMRIHAQPRARPRPWQGIASSPAVRTASAFHSQSRTSGTGTIASFLVARATSARESASGQALRQMPIQVAPGDEVSDQKHEPDVYRTERRACDASSHVVAADRAHRRVCIDRKRLQPAFVAHVKKQRSRPGADGLRGSR